MKHLSSRWILASALVLSAPGALLAQPVRPPVTPPVTPVVPPVVTPVVPPTPPAPPPPPPTLQLTVTQGINGQFANLSCAPNAPLPAFATVAAHVAGANVLSIDAGDLLGSATVTRMAIEHDANGVAQAVASMGLRALALGHRDIAAERSVLLAGARALAERRIPYVLSNLRCEGAATALCEQVVDAADPPTLLDSPAGRVAVLSFLSPSVLATIARDRAAGLTLSDPSESLGPAVTAARAAGARWVVVTLDPTWHSELTEALHFVNELTDSARPDLFVVNDLPEGMRSVQSEVGDVTVVASRAGDAVTVDLGAARPVRARTNGESPAATQFVETTTRWLCETHHRPLAGAHLTRPLELSEFGNLLVDVLRDQTGSEVGIVNLAAVRSPGIFPLHEAVTELDVLAAIPFEDRVMVARVKGSVLAALAKGPTAARMILRGITVIERAVKINGRAIDEGAYYSVVTSGYIADGGDGGLGEHAPEFTAYGSQSLREMFLTWLAVPRPDDVDLVHAPRDPANHTRWRLRWTVDGTFAANSIRNDLTSLYNDAQLTRAEATTFRLDTEARADADHPSFTFDNGLRIQYGVARTGAGQDFLENLDLTSLRSAFTWRAWRGVTPRFYHPLPYAEAYVETEMDRPASRNFHHTQIRPTLGARFEIAPKLTFNLGAGIDWEVNDPLRHAEPVLVAAYQLQPRRLFSIGERNTEMQSSLEFSWRDPAVRSDMLVRFNVKFSIPLFDVLALTMSYDIFARAVGELPWAVAADANIGLKVTLDRMFQSFSW